MTTRIVLVLLLCGQSFGFAAEKPNIQFILADDLGYGDTRCYNEERGKIATPQVSDGRSTPGAKQANDVPVRWRRFLE